MGFAGAKRTDEVKTICIDEEEGLYVVGRRYEGDKFRQRASERTLSRQIEARAADKEKNYAKKLNILQLNGLEATCLDEDPYIIELKDNEGVSFSGEALVNLLLEDGYRYLIAKIDIVLDPSSKEFALSSEDCIAEGKRLRTIIGGGGKQIEKVKVKVSA